LPEESILSHCLSCNWECRWKW